MSELDKTRRVPTSITGEDASLSKGVRERDPWFTKAAKYVLSVSALEKAYETVRAGQPPKEFIQDALRYLKIKVDVSPHDLARIPSSGPLLIVSNHPFGGIEGLMLAQQVLKVRSDVKILANPILSAIEEMRDLFFYVDPYKKIDAFQNNFRSMIQAIRWLKQGKSLIVFPSGEVSHATWTNLRSQDPAWEPGLTKLIRKTEASVIPAYFFGRNGLFFQGAGLIHPSLRTALLPRQILNKKNRKVKMRFGFVLPKEKLNAIESDEDLTKCLRAQTYALEFRNVNKEAKRLYQRSLGLLPVAQPNHTQTTLARYDVTRLPPSQKLFTMGPISAYFAKAEQMPNLMDEIARARETAFRKVGEGTGKSKDIDSYDAYYTHIFLWNDVDQSLIGSYRLGLTDTILKEKGLAGLYTNSLFKINPAALPYLTPGIELGRSFVVEKYQRDQVSLFALWRGISEFMARHPRYKVLFGPVSLSPLYSDITKYFVQHYMLKLYGNPELSKLITPRCTLKIPKTIKKNFIEPLRPWMNSVEDISGFVKNMDPKTHGLPVLFKHYLKFDAEFIQFNVDPKFNYCLDAFIVVNYLPSMLDRMAVPSVPHS